VRAICNKFCRVAVLSGDDAAPVLSGDEGLR
jgi:hypothetical protein